MTREEHLLNECANIMRHEDYGVTPSDKAIKLIDKLLAQIDEAYQEWQVDGGDVRDWVWQIQAIRSLLSKA